VAKFVVVLIVLVLFAPAEAQQPKKVHLIGFLIGASAPSVAAHKRLNNARRHVMKTVKLFFTLAILGIFCAAAIPAQEKGQEKLGKVSFPTSCDQKV